MPSDFLHERHKAQLMLLQPMFQARNMPTHLVERSAQVPVHMLLVTAMADDAGRPLTVNISYIPIEETLTHTSLMQWLLPAHFQVPQHMLGPVALFAATLNGVLPLGQLMLREQSVYLRFMLAHSAGELLRSELAIELFSLYLAMYRSYAHMLEAVAMQTLALETAIEQVL
jgi:hypothetical protein